MSCLVFLRVLMSLAVLIFSRIICVTSLLVPLSQYMYRVVVPVLVQHVVSGSVMQKCRLDRDSCTLTLNQIHY